MIQNFNSATKSCKIIKKSIMIFSNIKPCGSEKIHIK